MSNTIINTYFIKALDYYPHNLEETIENLNYALSYDERNADAHGLLGKVYAFQLQNYEQAIFHFQEAICAENKHVDTFYNYIYLSVYLDDLNQAKKLIAFAQTIKGFSKAFIAQQNALIFEKQSKLKKAKKVLKAAIKTAVCDNDISTLKDDLKRIEEKLKPQKKKNSKKESKKKKKKKGNK